MKYLLLIAMFALAGCGASKQEKADACMEGAKIAIETMGQFGAQLPAGTDTEKLATVIGVRCVQ